MPSQMTQKNKLEVDKILTLFRLKKTLLRINILNVFIQSQGAMSQSDLIMALNSHAHKGTNKSNNKIDRVSIYRNLASLKEAGVLHEVDTNKYIFCKHDCSDHAHLLLFCQKCSKHKEVTDHKKINKFMSELSRLNFFNKQHPLFLRGICSSCQ